MMQRAALSVLRTCIAAPASQIEMSLGKALGSNSLAFSSMSGPLQAPTHLAARCPMVISGLPPSRAFGPQQQLRFAGDYKPEVPGNTIDNWNALRGAFSKDKPSSLGANYYANILVMGFAYWLNDSYYFPARTLWIGALVFTLLYVRKSFFTTPMAFKSEY
jgi:hypothetical protein